MFQGLAWLALSLLAACSFKDEKQHCSRAADCAQGEDCFQTYCIKRTGGSSGGRAGTAAAGRDAGAADGGGRGAMDTGAAGTGGTGGREAGTEAGMMPVSGTGGTAGTGPCQDGDQRPCKLAGDSTTNCSKGLQFCLSGMYGACEGTTSTIAEACNGEDDDCDGKTDEEIASLQCYTAATGCTGTPGAYVCKGQCTTGTQTCANGALTECTDAVGPSTEACSPVGTNEDCDDKTDETCKCTADQPCYEGTRGTETVSPCHGGTQTCTNGELGACTGQQVDEQETCGNEGTDNDCDGVVDDIPLRGIPCLGVGKMGVCSVGVNQCMAGNLACVTPAASSEVCNNADDDCDGMTDETFNKQTDPANCGSCGKVCGAGESCCGGMCINTNTNANNCGACGTRCTNGDTCCGGKCSNTMTDELNCGGCSTSQNNRSCTGANATCCGGSCANTQTDALHCGDSCTACTGTTPGCCAGSCFDLSNTSAHCGMCSTDCTTLMGPMAGAGGSGSCICETGSCVSGTVACTP